MRVRVRVRVDESGGGRGWVRAEEGESEGG